MFPTTHPTGHRTRQDALRAGALVEVAACTAFHGPDLACGHRFAYPVTFTRAAWNAVIATHPRDPEQEARNLHYTLTSAHVSAQVAAKTPWYPLRRGQVIRFYTWAVRPGAARRRREIALHLHIGPGDDGARVLTIRLPYERG